MNSYLRLLLLILIIQLPLCWQISAQAFRFEAFSVSEGLAQSQVYSLLEDSRGFLWMGTRGGGISRFDGLNFKTFSYQDSLKSSYITALHEGINGRIWAGTDEGLYYYEGNGFAPFGAKELPRGAIRAIFQDSTKGLWIGTSSGVWYYDGTQFTHLYKDQKLGKSPVNAFFLDSKNRLWIAFEQGLIKVENEKASTLNQLSGFRNLNIRAISEDANGNLWLGTYGNGILKYDSEKIVRIGTDKGLSSNYVQALYTDQQNRTWIGTLSEGISVWNPVDSSFTYWTEADGLCKKDVRAITGDSWGNIWIGTSGGGVCKYSGKLFDHYDQTNRLKTNFVYAIAADTLDRKWISASDQGFSILTDTSLTHYGRDSGFLNVKVKTIFRDQSGKMWLGTEGQGLATMDTAGFKFYRTKDGLSSDWVKAMVQEANGDIWIGAAGQGLTKMILPDTIGGEIEFKRYYRTKGLAQLYVTDLHLDKLGRLWIATRWNGLKMLENEALGQEFRVRDDLPSNSVRSIVEDSSGYLWIGTANAGFARMNLYKDSFKIEPIEIEEQPSRNIYLMVIDDNENLWVGTQLGIDEIKLNEERLPVELSHYGRLEGFEGIETCQNAVWKDTEGNLWFGTINGLTKYNPKRSKQNLVPPKLHFTEIRLFDLPLQDHKEYGAWVSNWGGLKPGLELKHHENFLSFDFAAINHSNPEKVSYQWRLEGLRPEWSAASTNRTVMFANLAPGPYTLEVKAFNEDDIPVEEPLRLNFVIQPPFWQMPWFRLCSIGSGLLLILLIFRWRLNVVRKKAKEEQLKLEMANNLLALEQKALQLQMNPHFIFNTLNSIQNLIADRDQKTARYYLAKFSGLMRGILENSRESWISLESEIAVLNHYLSLEQFSRGHHFEYNINYNKDMDPEEIFIPPMLVQPFVENAVIHGVANRTTTGNIEVEFWQENGKLTCSITDDGIGRAQARLVKSQIVQQHKSMGLQVTRERLDLLSNGYPDIKSVEIQDLVLADGSPGGTKVLIRIPPKKNLVSD